jgi:hypothetical protein
MSRHRKVFGLDLTHAEAAIAAFVSRITSGDPAADATRARLYSVGLTPNLIYSLKNKRQRELSAAKLVAALAACEDLEVIVVGEAPEGSSAPRWVVRAEVVRSVSQPPADASLGRNPIRLSEPSTFKGDSVLSEPRASSAIQLSLFTHLESAESAEIEMHDVQFTRREPHRADIRVDFVLKQRPAS